MPTELGVDPREQGVAQSTSVQQLLLVPEKLILKHPEYLYRSCSARTSCRAFLSSTCTWLSFFPINFLRVPEKTRFRGLGNLQKTASAVPMLVSPQAKWGRFELLSHPGSVDSRYCGWKISASLWEHILKTVSFCLSQSEWYTENIWISCQVHLFGAQHWHYLFICTVLFVATKTLNMTLTLMADFATYSL